MACRLLCASDFHLGRRTRHLLDGIDETKCSPKAAWERFIQTAIQKNVDAVLLVGDIVDKDNRYYETIGILEKGIRKLEEEGILVYGVSGNHDFETLHHVAGLVSNFAILGKNGVWESVNFEKNGVPVLRLSGWSFPKEHVKENPFLNYHVENDQNLPQVGLLHCDVNSSGSIYAPVSKANFQNTGFAAWVLGHIHKPDVVHSQPLTFYCGSPQGLDPTERGVHGAWLLDIDSSGVVNHEIIPLAGLRWEMGEFQVDDVQNETDFRNLLNTALINLHTKLDFADDKPLVVGYSLLLQGRTSAYRLLDNWIELAKPDLRKESDGIHYFFESIRNRAKANFNLEDLAHGSDPPGILAKNLLILENKEPNGIYMELILKAKDLLNNIDSNPNYQIDQISEKLDDDQLRQVMIRAGTHTLERLLAQKEGEL